MEKLTTKQVEVCDCLLNGKTPKEIAGELDIEVATVRGWQGQLNFQCYFNQQSNDIVAAGIKRHIILIAAALEPEKARGYVLALDRLKRITLLPTTLEDIQQDIFLRELNRRSKRLGWKT